ncbi:MAG: hypothetical protein WC426_09460 [Sulfuriferula sp.]
MTTEESTLPPFNTSSSDEVDKTTNFSNGHTDHINFQQKVEDEWDDFTTSLLTENSDKVEPWPHADFSKCHTLLSQPEASEKMAPWGDGTPAELYYSLEAASEIVASNTPGNLKFDVKRFVKLCEMGEIEIVMFAPDDVEFLPADKFWLPGKAQTGLAPHFLSIYPHDCQQLLIYGKFTQSDFEVAYRINYGKFIKLNIPDIFNGKQATWRAFKQNQKQNIELTISQLFIRHIELLEFVKSANTIIHVEYKPKTQCISAEKSSAEPQYYKNGVKQTDPLRHIVSEKKPPKKRTPPEPVIEALNELLDEISKRMQAKGYKFDRNRMPGSKENLHELAKKYNSRQFNKASSTFYDYLIKICKFAPGQPITNAVNPYLELFPDYLK